MTQINYSQFPLWQRELIFNYLYTHFTDINFEHSQYAIIWEDPDDPEAPAKVTHPSPTWLAMAMHGDILPPVEVYWQLAKDESKEGFVRHSNGHLLHETPPIPAMTEEQAIEYIIQKDIPPRVWRDYKGNRTILKVVRRAALPVDRTHRNAWQVNQEVA